MNSRPPSTPGPRAVVAAHRPFCAQSRNIVSCLLIASLFISSCSMFNPYVEPETGQCPANADGTALSEAVQCASSWQNEYRGALQEHARFSSTIGTTLIIASAVALGIGATSGSSEAIIWIGAGGAAGYGVASWLSSKPREAAYLAGMKAMSCAISITQPLVALNATVTNLEGQLITLNTALGSAKPAYRRAEAALLAYQRVDFEPARLAIAQQAVESAANQIAATDQLYEEATSMRARYDAAPSQLLGAVERITVEVDALLAQTTADIQALPSIINGLADASGMFTSLAVTPPEPEVTEKLIKDGEVVVQADEPELRELIDAISELRGELDALATLARPIRVQVDNASSKVSLAALKDCGVDDDTLAGDILLTPSGAITVIADTAFNRSIMINGGKSPYQAEILEAPLNNIVLSQPVPFGPRIAIKGEPGMPVGDYTVYVADAAGHSTSLSLKVVAGGMAGAANRNSAGGQGENSDSPQASNCPAESEAPDAFELLLSVNAIKCMQAVIEIPESERDGVIGEKTRKALCKYQDNSNMTPTGRITQTLRDTLVKQFGQVLGEESDCQ